jgi:3-phenylpropionate/trans-cinnamate dioxygenase ferredoxin subunit
MTNWVEACAADDIEEEDVIRFDHAGRTFALYRSPDDEYYATDGLCTHEQVHLADGLVMDHIIECPKHNGRFDYTTGQAKGAPVCVNLKTYPVKVEAGKVMIEPFQDVNQAFWPRLNVLRRDYFRGRIDDLRDHGLEPVLALADFPQEAFLKACAVLAEKRSAAAPRPPG